MIQNIKNFLKRLYFYLLELQVCLKTFWWKMTAGKYPDYKSIPIIINNFNRLDTLKKLINSLESRGYNNIIILDNDSTYPPLLEYYKSIKHEVVYLGQNVGYLALWKTDQYKRFEKSFYVYTDSDVVIDEQCPDNFMELFLNTLKQKPACLKVGFGIRIDDIPDYYKEKDSVIWWEKQYWTEKEGDYLYKARIDTTFALYRPYCKGGSSAHLVYRTGFPYVIQHLPWYQDTDHLTEEEQYYIDHTKKSTFWTGRLK